MRFYSTYTNRRHNSYGAGILAGDPVHTRGWDAGVKVTARDRLRDEFDVYMTGGSHAAGRETHLGTVKDTADGPRWVPAGIAPVVPAHADGKPVITAIPVSSHLNEAAPSEYVCVVQTGSWPSGEPRFGTARLAREDGEWTVTGHSDYWDAPMSQTQATSEIVRLAGHQLPARREPAISDPGYRE